MKNLIAILIIAGSASAQEYELPSCEVGSPALGLSRAEAVIYATTDREQAIPTAYSSLMNNFWQNAWASKPAQEPQVIINNYYR
jgi:hypothetical protein